MPSERAKSSTDIMKKDRDKESVPVISGGNISVSVTTPQSGTKSGNPDKHPNNKDKSKAPNPKTASMKRQRSYERGASEGALNLPVNARGRRASCDMRAIDSSSLLNNNNIQPSTSDKGGGNSGGGGGPTTPSGLSEKELQHLQKTHQQYLQQQQQQKPQSHPQQQQQQHQTHPQHPQQQNQVHPQHQQHSPHQQQQQRPQQQQMHQQQQQQSQQNPQQLQQHERGKVPSDLAISSDTRRRSVQM